MKSASMTELRNQLSAYLKSVVGGESLPVTDRRKPIALLQPLGKDSWDVQMAGLIAAGIVSPPKQPLRIGEFLKLSKGMSGEPLTSAVIEDREGR